MPALISGLTNATTAADRLILDLSRAVANPSSGNASVDTLPLALSNIQKHARLHGFSSKQCEQLLRLALLGRPTAAASISIKPKAPKTSVSLAILRCVIPRPNAKLGREAVLDAIASLGPSPATDTVKSAGLQKSDNGEATLGPVRVKVDSKVQVAALKLLCVLLESPSVPLSVAASFYTDTSEKQASTSRGSDERDLERLQRHASQYTNLSGSLPTSYLTRSANSTLEKCYSTLFHYLDYQTLRPQLCYLLCRLTKRRHVRHYRITKLMALRANSAPDAGISALLSTYANFYPDLLFPELLGGGGGSSAVGAGPVTGLKYPDPDWIAAVLLAQARCERRSLGQTVESDNEDEGAEGARASKKQRLSSGAVKDNSGDVSIGASAPVSIAIPNLVTIQPMNSVQKAFGTHPSLVTELSSLRHLAHSLDRLVLPSQAAAMLGSGFGARLMRVAFLAGATITNEDSLSQTIAAGRRNRQAEQDLCWARLSDWLESVLADELGVHTRSSPQTQTLKLPSNEAGLKRLTALLRRARYVFELADGMPAKIEDLTSSVLLAMAAAAKDDGEDGWNEMWDELAKEVLEFVPLVTPTDLSSWEERFMIPLENIARSNRVSLDTSAAVVMAFAGVLASWAVRDWVQIARTLDARNSYRWGISNLGSSIDYAELIATTCARASTLASSLTGLYPRHVLIEHATLTLFETLSGPLIGLRDTAAIPPLLLYAFTFHATTIVPVTRLCGLVQDLRAAFEEHNNVTQRNAEVDGGLESKILALRGRFYEEENVATLNSTVTLVANLVWLGKIFTGGEVGSLPPGLEASVVDELTQRGEVLNLKLINLANTPYSRALSHLTERFANLHTSKQDAERAEKEGWIRGPITPKTLKGVKKNGVAGGWTHTDFRAYFLDWLEKEGVKGLYRLMEAVLVTFGRQLREIREKQVEA